VSIGNTSEHETLYLKAPESVGVHKDFSDFGRCIVDPTAEYRMRLTYKIGKPKWPDQLKGVGQIRIAACEQEREEI
jgi:hypothetical protein